MRASVMALGFLALVLVAPPAFAEDVTPPAPGCVPRFENGGPAGYLCGEQARPEGDFERLGLRNGDVIRSIDGRPVDSPSEAFQKLQQNLQITRTVRDEAAEE